MKDTIPKTGAEVNRQVLVSFLEALIFTNIVQVVTTNDYCSLHLHLENNASQDTTTDADIASEWTFLVDVRTFNCLSIKQI